MQNNIEQLLLRHFAPYGFRLAGGKVFVHPDNVAFTQHVLTTAGFATTVCRWE
jgi:hypothetical protein